MHNAREPLRAGLSAHARCALLAVLAAAALAGPHAARAQVVRPWTPPLADSVLAWSAQARVLFQQNRGDSATGPNYDAYDYVGRIGRRLVRALGRSNVLQAPAIKAVLDSLGLDTDVAIDAQLPTFVLLMVRNPFRPSAAAVGFLYWFRVDDLRIQGVLFHGGGKPTMRVWYVGKQERPYEWAVLDWSRGSERTPTLVLLRLSPDGYYWNLVQYEGRGPDLSGAREAVWADVNRDGVPELVTWSKARGDTLFETCSDCPQLLTEQVYVERANGFILHDSRLLPSPYATLVLFVRLLLDQNHVAAARLLADPAKLREAIALGWGTRRAPGTWKIEYREDGEVWPTWLDVRFHGARGDRRYRVEFAQRDARWVIQGWRLLGRSSPAPTPGVR